MSADDLSAPLGQKPKKKKLAIKIPVAKIIAGVLGAFLGVFVLWAVVADDPFGGEPMASIPANVRIAAKNPTVAAPQPAPLETQQEPDSAAKPPAPNATPDKPEQKSQNSPGNNPGNTTTVTIIDGKTGARQDVQVAAPTAGAAPAKGIAPINTSVPPADAPPATVDQKFLENTPHGSIPKIAADGTRPADAFAKPVKPLANHPDAPRVALIVGGLGVSTNITSDAIARLPGPVTLGFVPYGSESPALVLKARNAGHEILLQVPMEPFEYPDNDPGPQTLLTSLTPQQNIDRLYWLMSRFQGYVGIANTMGARFTASEQSFGPILHEIGKRGLIFVDDGANPRSVAARVEGASSQPFAQADVVIDAAPTPGDIDRALGRLEMAAREHGMAVGIASALPVSIDHIAKWAKAAESRGLQLVPITVIAAAKAKQT